MQTSPTLRRLLLATLLGLTGATRSFGHSATEPAPRPEEGWQKRQASLNSSVVSLREKAQVIFIGDSITQGWEGEGKEVWARYYAPRNAINLGIGGDRTQHVLWRLTNGNLDGVHPKAVVLMIGTNNSNGEDNSVAQIADGVTAIVRLLRDRLPAAKILLLPIFPRSENPSPQRGKVLQVNQILQKLADDQNVLWVDFGHRLINPDGTIPRDLMPDYLHLSSKGYALWAESIEPRLAAVLGDTPVTAMTGGSSSDLSGEWVATIPGPEGKPVDVPFTLKQDGTRLTGRFARGDGRFLDLQNGQLKGSEVSWTVKRDRASGGSMTYEMSAKLDGAKLAGTAKTDMDGNAATIEWSARRR